MRTQSSACVLITVLVLATTWATDALARGSFKGPGARVRVPHNHLRRAKAEAYWHQTHQGSFRGRRIKLPPGVAKIVRLPKILPHGLGRTGDLPRRLPNGVGRAGKLPKKLPHGVGPTGKVPKKLPHGVGPTGKLPIKVSLTPRVYHNAPLEFARWFR